MVGRATSEGGCQVTTDGRQKALNWSSALKRFASGPLLGFVCLALALAGTAVWWGLTIGHAGWFILDYSIIVAAAALNAGSWLAAALFGRTRQLRASWFVLLTAAGSLIALSAVSPQWSTDSAIVFWTTMLVLGFPSSMIFMFAASHGALPHWPWGLDRAIPAPAMLGLLASTYLQPFVLLPWLFRWRAKPNTNESEAPLDR
jgi:hypothetical protein